MSTNAQQYQKILEPSFFDMQHRNINIQSTFSDTLHHLGKQIESLPANQPTTRRRLNRIYVLYQVALGVEQNQNLASMLDHIIKATKYILNAEVARFCYIERETQTVISLSPTGDLVFKSFERKYPQDEGGITEWVLKHGKPYIVNDVAQSQLYQPEVDSYDEIQIYNTLCIPLLIHEQGLVGVLQLLNKQTAYGFTQDDIEWLTKLRCLITAPLKSRLSDLMMH